MWAARLVTPLAPKLVLTAHGSQDPRSAANARAVADRLAWMRPGLDVRLAFCELNAPSLADVLTLTDVWPTASGKELVYIGDWNNVSRSLWQVCSSVGLRFRAICPEQYGPGKDEAVEWSTDPLDVKGADAIYTDVWASMGQEAELEERVRIFRSYQVNEKIMAATGKPTLFMHCLPAHRGQEVTDSVIESESSVVFQQAANRLPIAKAILVTFVENSYESEGEEGRARLLGRPGHVDHHSMAQRKLWM